MIQECEDKLENIDKRVERLEAMFVSFTSGLICNVVLGSAVSK